MRRFIIFLMVAFLITAGLGCRGGSQAARESLAQPVTLKWWGVFENSNDFTEITNKYSAMHPNVRIEYRRLRPEEYETELVRAFAENRGPDIFMIHDSWLRQYQSLIQPMPSSVKVVFLEERGGLKKEIVPIIKELPTITTRQLKDRFVDVVVDEMLRPYQAKPGGASENRVWGLPFSVDTMALYYNRDLLNTAGIATPPEDWKTFQTDVKTLTRLSNSGEIVQSGAAIGTAKNVDRATDLLLAIMTQNGAQVMSQSTGAATFATPPPGGSQDELPALDALRFYSDFANPLKEVYTWNNKKPNSFEAFANGATAFFFGYSYHAPLIRARNPKLDFAVTKLPQIPGGNAANIANYWAATVAKDSKNVDSAWDFIQFATGKDQVQIYLDKVRRPTALRELVDKQMETEDLFPFASQVLTAKGWYRGKDAAAAESALVDLIENVLTAENPLDELRTAQNKINQTL